MGPSQGSQLANPIRRHLAVLGNAPALAALHLDLQSVKVGPGGMSQLVQVAGAPHLRTLCLDLQRNGLHNAGASTLNQVGARVRSAPHS